MYEGIRRPITFYSYNSKESIVIFPVLPRKNPYPTHVVYISASVYMGCLRPPQVTTPDSYLGSSLSLF
jgi:hypothetical protein